MFRNVIMDPAQDKPMAPPPDQPYPPQQPMYPQQGYPPSGHYPPGQYPLVTQQPAPYAQSTHTTLVMPQQPVVVRKTTRNWSTGLCGCFDDCDSLLMGLCCPCLLLCDVSSRMGDGCWFVCCCPGSLLGLRIKLRLQENIQGSLFNDYFEVQCCPTCVLCQLARELNHVQRK